MTEQFAKPRHGGDLIAASRQYGIAVSDWLDLSTGINPDGYDIAPVPDQYYRCLPSQADQRLQFAAADYYGCKYGCRQVAAAAGSQQLIQLLPGLRGHSRVAIPNTGYQEHGYQWQQHGHVIVHYDAWQPQSISDLIANDKVDCVVLINPSNPTAVHVSGEQLRQWQHRLAQKSGWLIIDEAFADVMPQSSFARYSHLPGVIVLRSLGKFFGLAGIRVGFALCEQSLSERIVDALGPWCVAGPSQYIALKALQDKTWQSKTRERLLANSHWMLTVLRQYFPQGTQFASAGLFVHARLRAQAAKAIKNSLAQSGILIRYWDLPRACRFSGDESSNGSSNESGNEALLRMGLISSTDEHSRQYFQSVLSEIASSHHLSSMT